MKISVITVLNTVNYGSVLQSYATKAFFQKLGHEVEFVDYWRNDQTAQRKIIGIVFDRKDSLKKWIKKPVRDMASILSVIHCNREFRSFIKEHLSVTPLRYTSNEELKINCPKADIYCTGSDQMWNSSWNQGIEKSFFLDYAPDDALRIAFSTSIGKTEIDAAEAAAIIPYLKQYKLITVREQSASELLNRYDIPATPIVDPTLLLTSQQWLENIPEAKEKKPYLLVYQLHSQHADADFDDAVRKISKEKKLEVVRVTYSYADMRFGRKIYCPSVFEFLSLLYHADYIVTDSFHGTAFSVNLNRPFSVVYPLSFATRMDSLLKMTCLEDRRYTSATESLAAALREVDFSYANEVIDNKRKEVSQLFQDFLCNQEGGNEK